MSTRTRFEKEANGNSEMAYFHWPIFHLQGMSGAHAYV